MDVFLDLSSVIARSVLSLVFIAAGLSKARAPVAFESSLAQYGLVAPGLRPAISRILPPLELVLGAVLLAGALLPVAAAIAVALLAAFTGVSLAASKQGASACGCFGPFETTNTRHLVARNVVLSTAGVLVLAGSTALTLEAAAGLVPALAVALGGAAALLLWSRSTPAGANHGHARAPVLVGDMSRRSFLGKLAVLGAGSVAAAALSLRGATPAAAACYGCGTCEPQYYYAGCVGQCYAAFWVAPFEYCEPQCVPCGSWTIQNLCCYTQCC